MVNERIQRRIERLLDQIDTAEASSDWQEVVNLARDVLAIDEENREALAYLQTAERRLGNQSSSENDSPSSGAVAAAPPTTDSAQPASFSDGRYQVQRFLGEGGKKMVYLAQDTLLDRDVAFALIKTEGLDVASRERISREAQAMGRLGSHPHIVTVFDLGEHESQPFMVVELLGGGDVEGVLEDAEGGKLPLEQAISIAVETCRGLEFAHSRGIIHRDLKPGNIWLTEDGVAKIGDFGLAMAMDRSRLTAEGMMVGTVSYMPPEQAMGGEVTPRADLYSLGAMLYEMVCGRPPFLGDDNIAIIGQHINTPPVAPTWHRSDCPRPLEALIMRLLSKDPSERPDSASDVLAALEAADVSSSEQSITEPEVALNVLDSLAGDVFVGRQREMDDLKAALEDALGGRGRMVTLVGEPGIGKTRTSQELATYAGLRGCQVLWGRCYEEQGVPSYWPWVQAIRSYVRERDPEGLSSEMGSGAADIAEIVSDVRDRLPGLPRPQQIDDPESARFRLFDSITAFLKTASERQPLMLIIDDLHWSDRPSLLLLQFLARELSGSRMLLVGTYRDVELNRQHPLSETLGELVRERLFERVLLRGLSLDDVNNFIEITSGIAPPRMLAKAVHTQTEGNPLFITEVVRLLAQEGEFTLQNLQERESWEIRVPEGVREVIGRRLNRLSQRCNDTLIVAAVIGREFTLQQLDGLMDDLNQDMLLDVLEEGLTARVIEEFSATVGLYQFTHALIQETLVSELTLTRRVRLHARISLSLELLYADDLESHAAELAHHFAQAEAATGSDKMITYSIMAGNRAMSKFAWEDAGYHFENALEAKSDQKVDRELADILYGLGTSLHSGLLTEFKYDQAHTFLKRAFSAYMEIGDLDRAVKSAQFPLIGPPGSMEVSLSLVEDALNVVPSDTSEEAVLLSRYAQLVASERGDVDAADQALNRAMSIASSYGDPLLESQVLSEAASVDGFSLRPHACIEKCNRALKLVSGNINTLFFSNALTYFTLCLITTGDATGAKPYVAALVEYAKHLQSPIQAWISQMG